MHAQDKPKEAAQPAAAADAAEAAQPSHHDASELPRAVVQRLVKSKLQQLAASAQAGKSDKEGSKKTAAQINKDALLALQESGRVFISFVAAMANETATEGKRKTISADDVFKALEDCEFGELVPQLRQFLEGG